MDDKKITKIEEVLNGKETDKPRAEQTLRLLEVELKSLIQQKKELKAKFQSKFQEINQEVEILTLQKQIQGQVLATERQENVKKLDKLIALNAGLEKGFKERKIDPGLMEELRKKIGAWE
ncbi:12924_t:CDS:2 [Entrophospora sp. SA101]|nr:15421_t:CDS:2 [Entrophospora sp. SA101]CAJ0747020.1 12924_t:CDS:2 [Entrophospora sp. SA101]CAJ0844842.1 3802_t:CDS:2 [Entrophospora sp. SA101]CAJ0894395.1 13373_t:CDS:2 [Entrophospora sp. SA101]